MITKDVRSLALVVPLWGLASCRTAAPEDRSILSWRLVDDGGRQVLLEPDRSMPRMRVSLSRSCAAAGEVVEAEVWLPGNRECRRICIRPSRPGVRVLGDAECVLEGEEHARVPFTCDTPGRGGLLVTVR